MAKTKSKKKSSKQHGRAKPVLLSVAIAIILALFVGYGIHTFYPAPEYEDYCPEKTSVKVIETESECLAQGGKWTDYGERDGIEAKGWCDQDYRCRKELDSAREVYNRDVFFVTLISGIIAIILGVVLTLASVSSGIFAGGILTVIYGTLRYWGDMADVLRFTILGLVLALLIWVGYKKLKN